MMLTRIASHRLSAGDSGRYNKCGFAGLVASCPARPPTKPPLSPSAASDVRDPHAGRMRSPEEESNALRWGEAQFEAVVIAEMTRCFIFSASHRKEHPGRARYPEYCCDDQLFW